MNAIKAVAVAAVLFALGFGSGFPLLFRLAWAVAALLSLGLLWASANLFGIELRRGVSHSRAQVGQFVEERITLRNRWFLPKSLVEVRDYSTLPGHRVSRACDLGPRQQRSWLVRTACVHRGRYVLGPVVIATTDPFGLFCLRRRWRAVHEMLVFPATVDLPNLRIPMGALPGGGTIRQHSHDATPNSLGVRDYQPGDALNRIHWPSTARLRSLMVKEFELDPWSDIWIVLDGEGAVQAGDGDESTEEYAVKVAASLAQHYLGQKRAVGFVAEGMPRFLWPPDRGDRQLYRILESLSVLRTVGRVPLSEVLAAAKTRFARNSTVLIITPSSKADWLSVVRLPGERVVPVVLLWLDACSFSGKPSKTPQHAFSGLPSLTVKRGDDLSVALSSPVVG